jgi:hypothetical protein
VNHNKNRDLNLLLRAPVGLPFLLGANAEEKGSDAVHYFYLRERFVPQVKEKNLDPQHAICFG